MALASAGARVASGQVTPEPLRTQAQCNGQQITEVVVHTLPPTYGGVFSRTPWLNRMATTLHMTTKPSVVENLLLLKAGEPCSILLRRETERLLRAQPFLADASVTAYPDGPGSVRIEVITIDEPSIMGSIGISSNTPYLTSLKAGNSNFRGLGVSTLAGWQDGGFYRDTWQAEYSNFQMFSRPVQMHLNGIRRDHGFDAIGLVTYPFFTDLQRYAWRVAGGSSDDLIPFHSAGQDVASLGVRRDFFDVAAAARVGAPGRALGIVGLEYSMEHGDPDDAGVFVSDTGLVPDSSSELRSRYSPFQSSRLNLLLGYRWVNFLRVSGFDALSGAQDLRRGVQATLAIGRGFPRGNADENLFVSGSIYGGVGSAVSFAGLEVMGEGRRMSTGDWEALLVSGRFGAYLRPHPRHTVEANIEYSAGHEQWLPFQLALGDRRGGVRGYEDSDLGGAARLVGRIEERWRVGNIRGTADAGVALFAEAGKLWAGDAPYGVTTGYMPSIGVALMAAIPPRSRRMWRVDFAVPLDRTAGAQFGMRFSYEDRTRSFWREPNDVHRNRERSGARTAFVVP
jgi:hypothetical protein